MQTKQPAYCNINGHLSYLCLLVNMSVMRIRFILPLVVLLSLAAGAKAQFTLNTMDESAKLTMPMNIYHVPLQVDVVNDAKARVMRKALWRQRNLVDMKVSFTGTTTVFNKSWATNNQNSVSGLILAYYYHTYERNRFTSIFKFDGQYGMNYLDDAWFKNQDYFKLYYLSSWKLKKEGHMKNWAYSFSATFASQFTQGYESRSKKNAVWSNFMAPGTLNGGLGLTYTSPNAKLPFLVTIEPVSGNVLFVCDDRILSGRRQKLGIPVTPVYGSDGTTIVDYDFKNFKAEGGSNFKLSFNRTFKFGKKKGFSMQYNTTLSSFYGWITQVARHVPDGSKAKAIMPTVDWMNAININPIKFLTLQFSTRTVYDRSQVDKVQMQYFLSIGLTYSYKNK